MTTVLTQLFKHGYVNKHYKPKILRNMDYNYVIIRECNPSDNVNVNELVRNAYLSNVSFSWWNAITKEITFQLIVVSAAVMFIFMGVPLPYCVLSIPFVLILIYLSIYSSLLMKAMEVTSSKRPIMSWVAEVYEPYFSTNSPEKCSYKIIDVNRLMYENIDVKKYKKRIIGTVAVSRHIQDEDVAWLFKLAVDSRYRRKGIGHCLIQKVQNWSRTNHFSSIQLAISECQEYARQLFTDCQFDVKQLYHKPIFGNALTLQMYHLEAKIDKPII